MKSPVKLLLLATAVAALLPRLAAQVPTVVLVGKTTNYYQRSTETPVVTPRPVGSPEYGQRYQFSVEVNGEGDELNGITAPTVTLAAGSTAPTANVVGHNGGTLVWFDESWNYGVGGHQWATNDLAVRDELFADGSYTINLLGTSVSLNLAATASGPNIPQATLTGGAWASNGRYLINTTQALTIESNVFTNYAANANGVVELTVTDEHGFEYDEITFHSANPLTAAAPSANSVSHTFTAGTLTPGRTYRVEISFIAIVDQVAGTPATALAGSLNAAIREATTTLYVTAYSGATPQAFLHGVGDLNGGAVLSDVRDATRVGDTIYAVGGSSSHPGSNGIETATIWTSVSGLTAIPDLVSNNSVHTALFASAITPNGAHIATRLRAGTTGLERHAARTTSQGLASTDLGYLPGFPQFSAANAISANGAILAGFARGTAGGANRAVRMTVAGPTITAIPFANGTDDTSSPAGRGISANGNVIVGTSSQSSVAGGAYAAPGNTAFRYVEGTGTTAIPKLAGGTWNGALAVTPDGNVVLVLGDSPSAPQGELYKYNATTGAITALGTPNGSRIPGNLGAITGAGGVVAISFYSTEDSRAAAYIWNAQGWHKLRNVLAQAGVDLTGWELNNVTGISADGTLIWGNGLHNGTQEGWVVEVASGYLAAATEPVPYSTPNPDIVGAWTFDDTTTNQSTAIVFFGNGYYAQIEGVSTEDTPSGVSGFERGQYRWNGSVLHATSLLDTNGSIGLSGDDDGEGISASISGNTLTVAGGEDVGTRVTGGSPIVGAWGSATGADDSTVVVFLPNGRYFLMADGAANDPSGRDGIEYGTYAVNAGTGALTVTPSLDTNGEWGLSHLEAAAHVSFSNDHQTLVLTIGSEVTELGRIGTYQASVPGDIDGDGTSEVVWRHSPSGQVATWPSGGGYRVLGTEDASWEVLGSGDFDGDGLTDMLWRYKPAGLVASWTSTDGYMALGTEDTNWKIIATGDFDADGQSDVLWRYVPTGRVASWTSTSGYLNLGTEDANWRAISTGDFDSDGYADVLWHYIPTGMIATWTSSGQYLNVGTQDANWNYLGTGDYDGDGTTDVLWRYVPTGLIGSWTSSLGYRSVGTEGSGWTAIGN